MSKIPSMPLFTDALIGDTTHLSVEEFGAYCLILFSTWNRNGRPLPDDDRVLARVCRVSPTRWLSRFRPILIEFFDISDGFLHQKRLEKEWRRAANLQTVQSENGKRGGRPKLLIDNDTPKATAFDPVKPNQSEAKAPIPIPKEREKKRNTKEKKIDQDSDQNFSSFWEAYPHRGDHPDPKKPASLKFAASVKAGTDPQAIIDGAIAYAGYVERESIDPKFVAQATTWLNGERWTANHSVNGNGVHHANGSSAKRDILDALDTFTDAQAEEWRQILEATEARSAREISDRQAQAVEWFANNPEAQEKLRQMDAERQANLARLSSSNTSLSMKGPAK